jgi:hypothetical protein
MRGRKEVGAGNSLIISIVVSVLGHERRQLQLHSEFFTNHRIFVGIFDLIPRPVFDSSLKNAPSASY